MRRSSLSSISAILVLLVTTLLPSVRPALAHPMVVDADLSDWDLVAPAQANLGHIARDPDEAGEYIWRDAAGDERTDFASPDRRVDLRELRITGDANSLYILASMGDIDITTGDGAPMLQVAVDTTPSGGGTWFGRGAGTQVNPLAAWERLLVTRFASGNSGPFVFDPSWAIVSTGAWHNISSSTDVIEMAVTWQALGLAGPPAGPLRFTVATFRATAADQTWDILGGSDALDCVSNYGSHAAPPPNTWTEVQDGIIDYYFEVWFEPDGDPYPPLVVSEFLPDPVGTETSDEWLEIYNTSPATIELPGVKVGDEETAAPPSAEGMYSFPSGTIASGGAVTVAQRAVAGGGEGFFGLYGFCPDYELQGSAPGNCDSTLDMAKYSAWAAGSVQLSNTADEILILDRQDTILDVAVYGTGAYPGVIARPAPDKEFTLERRPVYHDTNDCSVDFRTQPAGSHTPGMARPDLAVSKTGPDEAERGRLVTYTITYSNPGVNDAADVTIDDMLPLGVSFVSTTGAFPCLACVTGATGSLTWLLGTVVPSGDASFELVGRLSAAAPPGAFLTNSVSISTTDDEVSEDNNEDSWHTDVTPLWFLYLPVVLRNFPP
ncbi:MAG: lamin tail domain-containing protein [Chloroflexi bacterium]|nr:lamin tail domain-containing protein [Chloroflexota bacterium]